MAHTLHGVLSVPLHEEGDDSRRECEELSCPHLELVKPNEPVEVSWDEYAGPGLSGGC